MSVQQEHATSETATLTTTESGGVYQSLFDKINLTPVSSIQEIDLWRNSETLADASPDERVTAAIHVLLSCLAKSAEDVVMHQPDVQHVKSRWHGLRFLKCQKQKPDRAVV